jgi:RNA-binding protein Musashi
MCSTFFVDLYGNDEAAEEQPQQENDAQAADLDPTDTPAKIAPITPEVASKPAPPITEKTHMNGTPAQAPVSNGLMNASYTQQAPQQIPTYEQPLPNDYRETPVPRADGGYQNIPVTERSIRPSEMKDEG